MKKLILSVLAATLLLPATVPAQTWNIDPDHSSIGFKVRHLMVSNVKGVFRSFKGTVESGEKDVTSAKVNVTIETASIDTGVEMRDAHLKSADFFDVAKFPTMTFVSRKVVKKGNKLQMSGDLTLRGITKNVVLDVENLTPPTKDPWGGTRRGATATGKINRKDFGLNWNKAMETGGVVVGDEVTIQLEVEMVLK